MHTFFVAAALAGVSTMPLDLETEVEFRTTTVIVFDNGAIDAEPERATGFSGRSRDAALAGAFAVAEGRCGEGNVRQMGFDTHEAHGGYSAEFFYACR
jgi:hypothetical protein